jgi:hypothetical protein
VAVVSQYRAKNGPSTLVGSNCQLHPIVPWAPLCYASSFAFNAVILLLTIWKIPDHQYSRFPVGHIIFRDSLLYFFFTTVTYLTLLAIQCLGPSLAYMKPAAIPFGTLITTSMGCRLFLNLKLFSQRREAEHITPLVSHSKIISANEQEQMSNRISQQRPPTVAQRPHQPPTNPHSLQVSETSTYDPIVIHQHNDSVIEIIDYRRRTLPPTPPRQSIPEDIYPHDRNEQELDALLKNDDLRKDHSAA